MNLVPKILIKINLYYKIESWLLSIFYKLINQIILKINDFFVNVLLLIYDI